MDTSHKTAKHLKSVPPATELELTTATVLRRRTIKVPGKAIISHFLICGTLLGQSPTPSPTQPAPSPDLEATQINQIIDAQRFDYLARQAAQRINPRATLYRPTLSIAPNPTPAIRPSTPLASQEEADQTMQKSLADFANLAEKNPDQLQQQLASAMYLARDLQLRRVGHPSTTQHSLQRGFGSIKLPESGSIKDLGDIWQVNKKSQFGAPATTYSPGAVETIPADLALEVAPLLSITAPWAIGEPGWYSANYQSPSVVALGASVWSQKIEQFKLILLGPTEQIAQTLSWGKPQTPSGSPRSGSAHSSSTPSGSTHSGSTPSGSTHSGSTPNTALVPFWYDVIILVSHPQFAIWDYEPSATGDGPGLNALQTIGQLPGYSAVSIGQLSEIVSNWATGTTQYDTSWSKAPYFPVPLTPYECTSLLSLDPFCAAQWQGWPGTQPVSTHGSNPITDSGGRAAFIWGGLCGLNGGQATLQAILSQEGDNTSTMQVDYASRVDSALNMTVSSDGTITVAPINFGVTATAGRTSDNSAELDLSFKSSNESDLKNQVQIQGSLNNSESEIYITTYRDLLYGGMMFQDAGEPGPLKQVSLPCIWYGKIAPLTIKAK